MNKTLLIVDDEQKNINSIKRVLIDEDYKILSATDPIEGLKIFRGKKPAVILLDLRMPEMDGIEFMKEIKPSKDSPFSVIILTGMGSNRDIKECYNLGARAFLQQPINIVEIKSLVRNTFALEQNKHDIRLFRDKLQSLVSERTLDLEKEMEHSKKIAIELKKSNEKLREMMTSTVTVLASVVEMRDPYTAGHQHNVADLAEKIARELGLPEENIIGIRIAGNMHDIGKINIPTEILSKPAKLSTTEFNLIKTHPQAGYDLLKKINFPWNVATIVLQHHEKVDGSGYPNGLKDNEILFESKIIAVADVVEAITKARPYRRGLGSEVALKEIQDKAGTDFDEKVVKACVKLFKEKKYKFPKQENSYYFT
ncbi:MAG: response regulator [Candidatus Cloacimonadota bacterium]|nr:response regulator [Candidatus Cloacimonadota bacterium]